MKSLILSGVFLFFAVCDSASANIEWSYCDANGHVGIQNINLKGGTFFTGQELQSVTVPISYTCYTKWKSYGPSYYTTLNLYNMGEVVTALRKSGLGMDITVQEGTSASVTFTWKEIQAGFSGWSSSKVFGQYMDPEKTYNRSGTLTFRIFVYQAFKNNFLNITIPSSTI